MLPLRPAHPTRPAVGPRPHRPPNGPPTRNVRRPITPPLQSARPQPATGRARAVGTGTWTRTRRTRTTTRARPGLLQRVEEDPMMNTLVRQHAIFSIPSSTKLNSPFPNTIDKHQAIPQTQFNNTTPSINAIVAEQITQIDASKEWEEPLFDTPVKRMAFRPSLNGCNGCNNAKAQVKASLFGLHNPSFLQKQWRRPGRSDASISVMAEMRGNGNLMRHNMFRTPKSVGAQRDSG
jgi:hypothetical protein